MKNEEIYFKVIRTYDQSDDNDEKTSRRCAGELQDQTKKLKYRLGFGTGTKKKTMKHQIPPQIETISQMKTMSTIDRGVIK